MQELGLDNQPISPEAAAHREKFRFRFECNFCAKFTFLGKRQSDFCVVKFTLPRKIQPESLDRISY